MLFRLCILTKSKSEYLTIVVEYPDVNTLFNHLDDPGETGYRLGEILSILIPDIVTANLVAQVSSIQPGDTLIGWQFINYSV